MRTRRGLILSLCILAFASQAFAKSGLTSGDLRQLRNVDDVQISPSGKLIAYTVVNRDRPGRPFGQVWVLDVASGNSKRLGSESESGDNPRWSPDSRKIAYVRDLNGKAELVVMGADGSTPEALAPMQWTNGPLPSTGEIISWAPDGKQLVFVSSTPGPETAAATGDPLVFTRYLYKPTASEGVAPFSDNRRTHLFIADLANHKVRQVTDGTYYEHSVDWSPRGDEILFISNHEPDPDMSFNYDMFALRVSDHSTRRITFTKGAEYFGRWSPDGTKIAFQGTKRPLTSSETTMEDTHIWIMNADGSNRQEIGAKLDNRQNAPMWAADGRSVYLTVEERGNVPLYRIDVSGAQPRAEVVIGGAIHIGSWGSPGWSLGKDGLIAYACSTPADYSQLFIKQGDSTRQVTHLNDAVLSGKTIAPVTTVTFDSYDGLNVEAFLTEPVSLDPSKKYPMIVVIHGGPHGAQGPELSLKSQAYASHGFATLMVNYRGSTSYGQKFADGIFGDQDGGEARDVLSGVDAVLGQFPWVDADRLGVEGVSYGGQLSDWIITQTNRFKAAIPTAGISNLISFNFLSYYHDYLPVEYGQTLEQGTLMDLLWQHSAMRYVTNVHTPTMLVHGLNDNDVPTEEAEQYYIALKEVGVETILVLYPREGHGLQEPGHQIDDINRSFDWYDKHFAKAK
jgi:dipeptidyl aminopeptidase/acylaminoacyl peptidase